MIVKLQDLEPRESLHFTPVGDTRGGREAELVDLGRAILMEATVSDDRPGAGWSKAATPPPPPTQARLLRDKSRIFVSGLGAQVLQTMVQRPEPACTLYSHQTSG